MFMSSDLRVWWGLGVGVGVEEFGVSVREGLVFCVYATCVSIIYVELMCFVCINCMYICISMSLHMNTCICVNMIRHAYVDYICHYTCVRVYVLI